MSEIDRRTRKLLAFHKAHNPKDDAHRLYIKKKKKKKKKKEDAEDLSA